MCPGRRTLDTSLSTPSVVHSWPRRRQGSRRVQREVCRYPLSCRSAVVRLLRAPVDAEGRYLSRLPLLGRPTPSLRLVSPQAFIRAVLTIPPLLLPSPHPLGRVSFLAMLPLLALALLPSLSFAHPTHSDDTPHQRPFDLPLPDLGPATPALEAHFVQQQLAPEFRVPISAENSFGGLYSFGHLQPTRFALSALFFQAITLGLTRSTI